MNGGKVAVWNQPAEVREMRKDGRWTPQELEKRLLDEVGVEAMPILAMLKEREAAGEGRREAERVTIGPAPSLPARPLRTAVPRAATPYGRSRFPVEM